MNSKKITQIAIVSALAIIFGYIENMFPLPLPIYGAKVGISNAAVLSALYVLGIPSALGVILIKTACSSLLFGNLSVFVYSFCGGVLSLLVMAVLKKSRLFGIVGVSAAGGVFHNIGQLVCAIFMLGSINLIYYLPILIICGVIAGVIIGFVVKIILKRLKIIFR